MKRFSALFLVLVLVMTSFSTTGFAHGNGKGNKNGQKWNQSNNNKGNNLPLDLYDKDDAPNKVSVHAENGTYVGIDAQIKEEESSVDDSTDDQNDSGSGVYPNNPYMCGNGRIRVIIDNIYGRSWVEINYNGRDLDTIRGSRRVVLYVNRNDVLKVTAHDNENWYGNFSAWLLSNGYRWDIRNESKYTVNLSDYGHNQFGYIYMTPWYGDGSSGSEYDITYELLGDSHDAFGINPQNGRVFVKDTNAFDNEKKRTAKVHVKVTRNNKSTTKKFDVVLEDVRTPVDAVPDVGVVNPGVVETVYASDHDNNVFMINLEDKTTTKVSDTNEQWFDIANDHSTVLYGVLAHGNLYKNILDPNNTERANIRNIRESRTGVVNSLTVDDYGNMYFVDNAKLKYYNVFADEDDQRIQTVMTVGNHSLGDLVFHNDKLYYAAFKTWQSKGSQNYGVLVEIDIEKSKTKEIGNIPINTYGLASVNDKLYLLHGQNVSEFDFEQAASDPDFNGAPYSAHMNIGSNASSIYGSAQGDTIATGNILLNDAGDFDALVHTVNGQSVEDNGDYTFVYGYYGVLLIKPDGTYIYIMDSKSQAIKDLYQGETLEESFSYVVGYEDDDDTSSSTLTFTINAYEDAGEKPNGGLHFDAYDLDGDGLVDENVQAGQNVPVWHDSVGFDNQAKAQGSNTPKLNLEGIYGHRAVDFNGYAKGLNIARQAEVNDDKFIQKTIGTVFKTGDDISGVQYIFEEGGGWRGYNFVIAPNPENNNTPSLYAMVYNNKEWDTGHYYKPIVLTEVEPETVYFAFMTHDATEGTFRAYVNGAFTDITETEVLTNVEEQEVHPNPAGIGWFNSHTVYPHNKQIVTRSGGGAPFDGMIGEIVSWNKALKFTEIQDLNGELMTKWKPITVDAVDNINTLQSGNKIKVTFSPVPGISEYEIVLSKDNEISSDDKMFTFTDNTGDITLDDLTDDEVFVFVRYKVGGVNSEDAHANHKVLGQPDNFTYTNLEDGKTLYRFDGEEGKAYVVKIGDKVYKVPASKDYVVIDTQGLDPKSGQLYETAIVVNEPNFSEGHGLPAEGPVEKALASVTGLTANLVDGEVQLDWNDFNGAVEYEVKVGSSPDAFIDVREKPQRSQLTYEPEDLMASLFKYYKVRARVTYDDSEESGYAYSGYSETFALLTPVYDNLLNESNDLVDGAVEGPGPDGLYEPGEYSAGSKAKLQEAIEKADQAKQDYLDGKINEDALEEAYQVLESALNDFENGRVTEDNKITLVMNDDGGNPLSDTLQVGDGSLEIVNGKVTLYGPEGYELVKDISVDGFALDGTENYRFTFTDQPQTITLSYSDALPSVIDEVEGAIDGLGTPELGPVTNVNSDLYKFYEVGQYDTNRFEALKAKLQEAKDLEADSNATGQDKMEMADVLKQAWTDFESSLVVSANETEIKFYVLENGNDVEIEVNGAKSLKRYAPAGFQVVLNGPYESGNPDVKVFYDNYYVPVQNTLEIPFYNQPSVHKLYFEKTDLFKSVENGNNLIDQIKEGSDEDGYDLGDVPEGQLEDLNDALEKAKEVLNDPNATDEEKEEATKNLNDAIEDIKEKIITNKNQVVIINISAETGEELGERTIVYGYEGYSISVNLDAIPHYKPYIDPEVRYSDGEDTLTFSKVDVVFTDDSQTIYIMYRENPDNLVPASDKADWKETARESIYDYSENGIPWTDNSRYDVEDGQGSSDSTRKEYDDFLNILGNALDDEDKKYIDEDSVDDYIDYLEDEDNVLDSEEDIIDMLKKFYKEISDSFYSDDPLSGEDNGILDGYKAIYYEDPIDTSIVFKIKESNVKNPEFKFTLIGNKYLSFDHPNIQLYKLREGDDPSEDASVLNNGEPQPSSSMIDAHFDEEKGEYGYTVTVSPSAETLNKGDYYYVRILTKVSVNYESDFYADDQNDSPKSRSEKYQRAVDKLIDLYNDGVSDGHYIEYFNDNEAFVLRQITADELIFAIGEIHDGNTSIIEGLMISTQTVYYVENEDGELERRDPGEKVDILEFKVNKIPLYPDFIE